MGAAEALRVARSGINTTQHKKKSSTFNRAPARRPWQDEELENLISWKEGHHDHLRGKPEYLISRVKEDVSPTISCQKCEMLLGMLKSDKGVGDDNGTRKRQRNSTYA